MKTSSDHILTSHAGSLPRPDALIEANRAREAGEATDERRHSDVLRQSVVEIVSRQRELGIEVPGDGELGKATTQRINYGPWWRYSFLRLSGLEPGGLTLYEMPPRRSGPEEIVLTSFADWRDRTRFAAAYADPASGITTGPRPPLPGMRRPAQLYRTTGDRRRHRQFQGGPRRGRGRRGVHDRRRPGQRLSDTQRLLQDR